jgi:hypothetical protein
MMRGVLAALAIGALFAVSTPKAKAQTETSTPVQDSSVTLSGDSLRGIQGRSISTDFPTNSTAPSVSNLSVGSRKNTDSNSRNGKRSVSNILGFSKRIDIVGVGDVAPSRKAANTRPLPPVVSNGDTNGGVKVRYRLGQ